MQQHVLFMISSMRGGGSEQQTRSLLRHLDRSKFQPHLFLLEREGDLMSEIPDDVAIHSYQNESSGGIYFPGRVLRDQSRQIVELIRSQAIDVVYDRTFHMTMIAAPACRELAIPRVSTIVSPPHQALPAVESRFVDLKRRRLAKAYQQAKAVVAVSHVAADSARSYYDLSADRVEVIHNGVDIDAVTRAASQLAPNRSDELTLVCVGRMTEEKGHRDLIDAIASLPADHPAIRLWMVGDGPLRTELQKQASATCGHHSVDFIGSVANPAPYIAAADGLVLPSRFEGLPNVVLEAMALETSVIATRAGGTVELERDQPTVLWCIPNHSASLAAVIRSFAADQESARERAAAAKRLVGQHHDMKSVARRVETLLASNGS